MNGINLISRLEILNLLPLFKKRLLSFIRPEQNTVFDVHNPVGLKYLTRLRLGLSHLNGHQFKHNFQDCFNPPCSCNLDIETTTHYLLCCHHYKSIRISLVSRVKALCKNFSDLSDDNKIKLLLYGDSRFDDNKNGEILKATITYIIESDRFSLHLIN